MPGSLSQFSLHASRGAPLCQLPETVCGDVISAPEGEIRLVRRADNIAEVGQPGGKREVFRMSPIRPDALHS